jgi:putative molybdopterin biosynthesis protein
VKKVETIHSLGSIKVLADARRLEILRLLMASPATLTQLARTLERSPAWIRHHILALESAGLVEVSEIRKTKRVTEKFYRARSDALLLQEIILPKASKPMVIFSGSHDLAVDAIAVYLQNHLMLLSLPVGSLDGLVNLRHGLCQISGAHLLDESGEYNTPFVRHIFPDRDVEIITLAYRTQGLMLADGNPKGLKRLADLATPGIQFVNRNPGSGTRLWLDTNLRNNKIPSEKIEGYQKMVSTHTEAAALIQSGKADAAIGLQAAAFQHGLSFIPLFEERYDLVLPREQEKILTPLLDYLQTSGFRKSLTSLSGYNTVHSGEQVAVWPMH